MEADPAASPMATVPLDSKRPCVKCSYNLAGLPVSGVCPECGTPVEHSLRGVLLEYASPEYLSLIRGGLSLVLNGILLQIAVIFISIVVGLAVSFSRTGGGGLQLLMSLVATVPAFMIFIGYWRFTEPDPGFVGVEKPDTARKVIRVTVCVQAAFQLFSLLINVLGGSAAMSGAGMSASLAVVGIVALLLSVGSVVAWIVQFFAVMMYLRWLALRVPDAYIGKRASTYMWLLPVLQTVGIILIGLGPLIALILYWNLLDRVRTHLKSITRAGHPAVLQGMASWVPSKP